MRRTTTRRTEITIERREIIISNKTQEATLGHCPVCSSAIPANQEARLRELHLLAGSSGCIKHEPTAVQQVEK